jgi:hypothetical protein
MSQKEVTPAKMGTLEKAESDPSQGKCLRIGRQPGRNRKQAPGVIGAISAFWPWTLPFGVFEDSSGV